MADDQNAKNSDRSKHPTFEKTSMYGALGSRVQYTNGSIQKGHARNSDAPGDSTYVDAIYKVETPDAKAFIVTEGGVTLRATKPFQVVEYDTSTLIATSSGPRPTMERAKETTILLSGDISEHPDIHIKTTEISPNSSLHMGMDSKQKMDITVGTNTAEHLSGFGDRTVAYLFGSKVTGTDKFGNIEPATDPKTLAKMEGKALKALGVVAEKDGKPVEAPVLTSQDLLRLAQKNLESKGR